jgi:predicted ATPase/class 3 adenylate cyclase
MPSGQIALATCGWSCAPEPAAAEARRLATDGVLTLGAAAGSSYSRAVSEQPSGTVTFLFSDIEGSTRLLAELGRERYAQVLAEHRRVLREAFARHVGYEVDCEGDSFFVAFQSASEAAAAAAEAQAALADGPVRVRMGVHTGEALLDPPKYVGLDVHRAARIMASAHGGQVVLSQSTRDLLGREDRLRDLGWHRLKDLAEPVRLFQLGVSEFPPLRSLNANNLPAQPSPLVGRERELAKITALVDEHRLVTLTGPGGTGKTRLALRAAAELVTDFPDGVFWAPLAALRDPDLVLPTIEQALGAKVPLQEHVDERRMLLLLDNLEQIIEAAPALAETLAHCPNLTLLVTSRILLRVSGEREYQVPPLVDAEAVTLFRQRAASAEPEQAVREICRCLDGLPLAIELAAARTRVLAPDKLLERLEQRLPLLTGGARDAPERQRTLRATIGWSYDLLNAEERELFASLSVFAGGFALEAVEEVCHAALDTLQALVEHSLVRQEGERFAMLETIREFALERLQEEGEVDRLLELHAEYFLALAEKTESALHGPGQTACLDRLEAEHGNFRAALGSSPPERRLRLAAALSWYWQLRSYLAEGLGWLQQALDEAEAATVNRARALDGAGRLAFYGGDRSRDCRLLEESADLMRELGDEDGLARSLAYLGIAAGVAGDADTARTAGEDAVALGRAAGGDWTQALALWGLGTNYFLGRCGPPDTEAAAPLLEESAALFTKTGDKWGLVGPLLYLGRIARESGDPNAARRLLSESSVLSREVGDKFRLNLALHGLGDVAGSQGDGSAARASMPRPWKCRATWDERSRSPTLR